MFIVCVVASLIACHETISCTLGHMFFTCTGHVAKRKFVREEVNEVCSINPFQVLALKRHVYHIACLKTSNFAIFSVNC